MRSRDRDLDPLVPAVIVALLAAAAAPFAFPVFTPAEPAISGGPGSSNVPGVTGDTPVPGGSDRGRDGRDGVGPKGRFPASSTGAEPPTAHGGPPQTPHSAVCCLSSAVRLNDST